MNELGLIHLVLSEIILSRNKVLSDKYNLYEIKHCFRKTLLNPNNYGRL
jgi:hypothetical protein